MIARLRFAALAAALLFASGCKSETSLGQCIGLNGHENPALVYSYSARNIFWGIVGVEFVYPPIKVALDEAKCPTSRAGGAL